MDLSSSYSSFLLLYVFNHLDFFRQTSSFFRWKGLKMTNDPEQVAQLIGELLNRLSSVGNAKRKADGKAESQFQHKPEGFQAFS